MAGADEAISRLVEHLGIPDAKDGFKMTFSAGAFPGHQVKAAWLREETPGTPEGGNWYRIEIAGESMEGWLCPALFKYFDAAPMELFMKLEPRPGRNPVSRLDPVQPVVPAGGKCCGY